MRKLKYMIIEAENPMALEEAVSHYLDRGWRCTGGPKFFKKFSLVCFMGKKTWYQAVSYTINVKPTPENSNVVLCPLCTINQKAVEAVESTKLN